MPAHQDDLTGAWGHDLNLTRRQAAYVRYWFSTRHNRIEAARLAGYSPGPGDEQAQRDQLSQQAYQLHDSPAVREAIRREWLARGADVTADEVVATLAAQLRADLGLFLDDDGEIDPSVLREHGRLVEGWTNNPDSGRRSLKLYSSQKAAELIGRALGLWDKPPEGEQGGRLLLDLLARVIARGPGPADGGTEAESETPGEGGG